MTPPSAYAAATSPSEWGGKGQSTSAGKTLASQEAETACLLEDVGEARRVLCSSVFAPDLLQRARMVLLRLLRPLRSRERHGEGLLAFGDRLGVGGRPWQEQPADLFSQQRHQARRKRRP